MRFYMDFKYVTKTELIEIIGKEAMHDLQKRATVFLLANPHDRFVWEQGEHTVTVEAASIMDKLK